VSKKAWEGLGSIHGDEVPPPMLSSSGGASHAESSTPTTGVEYSLVVVAAEFDQPGPSGFLLK